VRVTRSLTIEVPRLLAIYARVMRVAGLGLAALILLTDHRWAAHPIACLVLLGAVFLVRAAPVRLSKYSYLTQTGIPALAGALTVGPRSAGLETGSDFCGGMTRPPMRIA